MGVRTLEVVWPVAGAGGDCGVKLAELSLLCWRDSRRGDDEEVAIALEVTPAEGERPDEVSAHEVLSKDRLGARHELLQQLVQGRKDRRRRPGSLRSDHQGIQAELRSADDPRSAFRSSGSGIEPGRPPPPRVRHWPMALARTASVTSHRSRGHLPHVPSHVGGFRGVLRRAFGAISTSARAIGTR